MSSTRRFAVNVADMTNDRLLSQLLLAPLIRTRTVVQAEKTVDGGALLLDEVDEAQFEGILHTVRLKHPRATFRLYTSRNGTTWTRA